MTDEEERAREVVNDFLKNYGDMFYGEDHAGEGADCLTGYIAAALAAVREEAAKVEQRLQITHRALLAINTENLPTGVAMTIEALIKHNGKVLTPHPSLTRGEK